MFGDKLVNYIQEPPIDGRSRLANAVDFVITNLLVWFMTITAVYLLNLETTIPAAIVSLWLLLESAAIFKLKKHRIKKLQTHRNVWYSAKQCRENLKKMVEKRDFISFTKELLEIYAPFENLQPVSNNSSSNIDLSGLISGKTVGIMCLNPQDENHKINTAQIKSFLEDIYASGYQKGIIITTGYYTDEARRYVRQRKGRAKIHLLDHLAVLRMAKKTGHPIFPDAAWQDDTEHKLTGLEMAVSIKENILASRKRALWFLVLGVALLVTALLNQGLVGLIYLCFGIVNLFIGITGIILSLLRQDEHIFS